MSLLTADNISRISMHLRPTIDNNESVRVIFDRIMKRSQYKYIPFLLQKADELGADGLYAGYNIVSIGDITKVDRIEYGIGFYKNEEFLGHVPFEREFLGHSWYATDPRERPLFESLLDFMDPLSIASDPRFVEPDRYEWSHFEKGPKLEFLVRQDPVIIEVPYKLETLN